MARWRSFNTPSAGKPQGVEIDVGLVYADYYFLEAITAYRASRGLPASIG